MKKILTAILALGSFLFIILIALDDAPEPIVVDDSPLSREISAGSQVTGPGEIGQPRAPFSGEQEDSGLVIPEPEKGNLTQGVAYSIAEGILTQDPNAPLSQEQLLGQILSSPINFTLEDFAPEVDESRFQIITDPTDEDYKKYFDNLLVIMEVYFTRVEISSIQLSTSKILGLISFQNEILNSLYKLRAPDEVADFHKEQIKLIATQKKSFEALANYQEDPLKAITAVQVFQETTRQIDALWKSLTALTQN
jgi:hypothetical protein